MALQLEQAGADGLVLFNRFYEPDIDLARLTLVSNLELSTAREIRLPLLWIGVLAGRIQASLAASTGVESADEVIKYLLAGADVVMTTSALLRHGIGHLRELLNGTRELARRAETRLSGRHPRTHEPPHHRGPGRLRAGELHQDTAQLPGKLSQPLIMFNPRRRMHLRPACRRAAPHPDLLTAPWEVYAKGCP